MDGKRFLAPAETGSGLQSATVIRQVIAGGGGCTSAQRNRNIIEK